MNTQAKRAAGPRSPSALDPEIAARLKRDPAGLIPRSPSSTTPAKC